jgi:hypothetical protein
MLISPKDFSPEEVEIKQVLLDPNNPRFSDESTVVVSDEKISSEAVQQKCMLEMRKYQLDDLKESIKKVGFVQIDKVVVRPLKAGFFVVVEGNRRIAALKILEKEIEEGMSIEEDVKNTILKFTVASYNGKDNDISWIIQGIRHISGVKDWGPYQQTEVLVKLTQQKKLGIREAANIVGIGPKVAGKLVRAWNAFQQAKKDEEYGQDIKPKHFSYFNEVIFIKPALQTWFCWDEKTQKFTDTTNLKKLFSWVFPEENKEPRISSAMQLRDTLSTIISEHPELLKRWENDENMTIDKLNIELGKQSAVNIDEWVDKIEEFNKELKDLSTLKIEPRKHDFINKLKETIQLSQKHIDLLSKIESAESK